VPRPLPFALIVLGGIAVCALATLLPNGGPLTAIKLALSTWATLILPGAVILRLLGWPASPAGALTGCAAWSVTALAPGFMLMLATGGGVPVVVLWLLAVIGVGLVVGRGKPFAMDVRPTPTFFWFAAGVVGFAALMWMGSWNNVGDAVEHIARMRKITELDPPAHHLEQLGLLPPDSGLHPGYAFPLWHATGAAVVWLSGLEETVMFRFWPTALIPFVAAAVYSAGRSMFGCRAAGFATCIGYLGAFAFPIGVGYFSQISYPGYICIFLFWPLIIERTFTYLREGGREPILTAAAASFAVSAIHPSYAPFMILLIGAFLVARFIMARDRRDDLRRLGVMLGAVTVPFLLFLIWLFPAADSSASTISRAGEHFDTIVNMDGDLVSMKADWLTRGGPIIIAALACIPLAAAATRTRAAAFVAGASAAVILILIVPYFFTPFADVMSISQGRRFLFYLPFAFALTGGALILARFRWFAVAAALLLGAWLHHVWPGDFKYMLREPGPGWLAWVAAAGALIAIGLGATKKVNLRYGNGWALAIVIAFVLPAAVVGIEGMKTYRPEPARIDDHLIAAVDKYVAQDDVILGLPKTVYRLDAQAPVYIVAAAGGHGGDTVVNHHAERRLDAKTFFDSKDPAQLRAILDRWDPQWVLVRKDLAYPREFMQQYTPVYEDKVFALYPVDPATIARIDALQSASAAN
jgi:hypothetical protein